MCRCECVEVFVPQKVSSVNACMRVHALALELNSPDCYPYDEGDVESATEALGALALELDSSLCLPCYESGATKTMQTLSSSRSNTAPPLCLLRLRGWVKHNANLNALLPCIRHLRVS